MKRAILVLLASLLLFSGCKGLRSSESSTERIVYRDSVVFRDRVDSVFVTTEKIVRDSVIIIKGQKTKANVQEPCDTAGMLRAFDIATENGRVYSSEGRIFFECYCEDVEKRYQSSASTYKSVINSLESRIEELSQQVSESKKEAKKYQRRGLLPWWAWTILGFILAIFLLRKLKYI